MSPYDLLANCPVYPLKEAVLWIGGIGLGFMTGVHLFEQIGSINIGIGK